MPRYPHLLLQDQATQARYTAISGGSTKRRNPTRSRAQHAKHLIDAVAAASHSQAERMQALRGQGFFQTPGITLHFESDPGFELAFESLELQKSGIRLLSVTTDKTRATVHIPDGKLQIFLNKLEAYRDKIVKGTTTPQNQALVDSIANIRLATLAELWTDDQTDYPTAATPIAWEVWLRPPNKGEDDPFEALKDAAEKIGYTVLSSPLRFVDRTVALVRGTREQLALGAEVLGLIAEVRRARLTADFFMNLSAAEQHEWSDDLLGRLVLPPGDAPKLGLLDTGVNRAHPLLAPVVGAADLHTVKPQWQVDDTHPGGHGTLMAGLAIYGDLTPVLASTEPVRLTHSLSSVKLFHAPDPHDEDLFGFVTIEAISRLEIAERPPVLFFMPVTAQASFRGRPSSWSAAIDNLAFGAINDTRRLILISAGNVGEDEFRHYPDVNQVSSVEDPAQAWNALAVGGFTEKVFVDERINPGGRPLAGHGDLAPSSRTSLPWPTSPKAPLKPDIVMEAGNAGLRNGNVEHFDELALLTTAHRFVAGNKPFTTASATSAATALAARLGAALAAQYPTFSPETIRGLLVHSARWTDAMRRRALDQNGEVNMLHLLRMFGYGSPDAEALFFSAGSVLTLIAQDEICPFIKEKVEEGKPDRIGTCDINLHRLPWPKDALQDLPPDTQVDLRVTLSYFVEPSPGERGWDRKYGYPSHGLRFKVKRALESFDQFRHRINAHDREDDYADEPIGETGAWQILGAIGPTHGSIHSNVWRGPASELAERECIAVHPTTGWWRTRPSERRLGRKVAYSLVVTITTPEEAVDIYTPVANQVGIEILPLV